MILYSESTQSRQAAWCSALQRILSALLLYIGLWGSLSSMAFLSARGLPALLAGGLVAVAVCLLANRKTPVLLLSFAVLIAAGLCFLLQLQRSVDGLLLLLNRLFQASERAQAYQYDLFTVHASDLSPIETIFLSLGLLSGLLIGLVAGRSWKLVGTLLTATLLLWMAWLGITPGAAWLPVLLAGAVLLLLPAQEAGSLRQCILLCLCALLIGAVILLAPGRNPALQAWSDRARDTLAPQTVSYSDQQAPETEAPDEAAATDREYLHQQQERTEPAQQNLRPLWIGLILVALLLLLFLPSLLADRLRKKRDLARMGLEDADHAVCIRASFLYAMRLLQQGGLDVRNVPFSRCSEALSDCYPALIASFEAVLPLWQEAAYSDHPLTADQRLQMQHFLSEAHAAAFARMRPLQRLRCRLQF